MALRWGGTPTARYYAAVKWCGDTRAVMTEYLTYCAARWEKSCFAPVRLAGLLVRGTLLGIEDFVNFEFSFDLIAPRSVWLQPA